MKKKTKTIIICIFVFIVLVLLTLQAIGNSVRSFYSIAWVSNSMKEAKTNKVFKRNVEVDPKILKIEGRNFEITECWVEERTKFIYKLLFFPQRRYLGDYRLCFKVNTYGNEMRYSYLDSDTDKEYDLGLCDSVVYYTFVKNKSQKRELIITKDLKTELGKFRFEIK